MASQSHRVIDNMGDILFLVRVDDFSKIINDKRTPLRVIDDLTIIQPYGRSRLAYLCEAGGDYSICHIDEDPKIPPRVYDEVSYICYGMRCLYCGGVTENHQDAIMRISCTSCHKCVDALSSLDSIKLMIQNGTIIKEQPRWRWRR